MGPGAERSVGRVAALVFGFGLALFCIVTTPSAAYAHSGAEQAATNWHIDDVKISVATAGVAVSMTELDNHIRLRNTSNHEVIVYGYSGEPYLRVSNSAVMLNDKSPAGYINRSITAPRDLPDRFDALATPQWRKIAMRGEYEWHDHRAHHGTRASSDGRTWSIRIAIDNKPAAITGTFRYRSAPTSWSAVIGIIAVATLCGFGMLESRRQLAVRVIAIAFTGLFAAQLAAQWASSSEAFSSRLGVFAYGSTAVAAAFVAAVAATRRPITTAAPIVLFCAVAILVCAGLTNIDWLAHSMLPTVFPTEIAQAIVGAAIVGGMGLALIAIYTIVTEPAPARDEQ